MRVRGLMGVVVIGALTAAGCSSSGGTAGPRPPIVSMRRLVRAAHPIQPFSTGTDLYFGERLTGRIRHVLASGRLAAEPMATIPVVGSISDQRGLLGLARTPAGRMFTAGVRPGDQRLVVFEVSVVAPLRLVWVGPVSADRANGGALAVAAGGSLLVGIGDLLGDPALANDPSVPNRKILALDVDGSADQQPRVLSVGWNNPYAITVDPQGVPWVADNAGGRDRERIGRADRPAADARPLGRTGDTRAPAALVSLGGNRFGVCGFVSRRVDEVRVVNGAAAVTGRVVGQPCAEGAARLADGRLVTATEDSIWISRAPVR